MALELDTGLKKIWTVAVGCTARLVGTSKKRTKNKPDSLSDHAGISLGLEVTM